jgi:hypothetical protein
VVLQLLAFLFMSPLELASLFKSFSDPDLNQSAHDTRSKQSSHKSDTGSARRRSKGNKTGQKRKHEGDGSGAGLKRSKKETQAENDDILELTLPLSEDYDENSINSSSNSLFPSENKTLKPLSVPLRISCFQVEFIYQLGLRLFHFNTFVLYILVRPIIIFTCSCFRKRYTEENVR